MNVTGGRPWERNSTIAARGSGQARERAEVGPAITWATGAHYIFLGGVSRTLGGEKIGQGNEVSLLLIKKEEGCT